MVTSDVVLSFLETAHVVTAHVVLSFLETAQHMLPGDSVLINMRVVIIN